MTVNDMRAYISETYNSTLIRGKDIRDMADNQVIAIYKSLKKRGTKPVPRKNESNIKYEQLSFL